MRVPSRTNKIVPEYNVYGHSFHSMLLKKCMFINRQQLNINDDGIHVKMSRDSKVSPFVMVTI